MKKFLTLASVLALVFVSCNNKAGGGGDAVVADSTAAERREASNQIAYINIDSLMNMYDMFKELSGALEAKATKAQNDLANQGRSLERAIADAQEKLNKGLVTSSQAAELQEKLARQEQNYYQQRDKVQGELAEENQVMINNIYYSLNEYLKEFNSDYRYGIIMATSATGPILNADPTLDITAIVAKGLNERYAAEKAAGKK